MRTSFSLRVDKQRQVNESMDADYFGTYQRNEKLQKYREDLALLERQFLDLRERHRGVSQMGELMKIPEVKKVLTEIGDRKKKV
jgi:hypothetical protein